MATGDYGSPVGINRQLRGPQVSRFVSQPVRLIATKSQLEPLGVRRGMVNGQMPGITPRTEPRLPPLLIKAHAMCGVHQGETNRDKIISSHIAARDKAVQADQHGTAKQHDQLLSLHRKASLTGPKGGHYQPTGGGEKRWR